MGVQTLQISTEKARKNPKKTRRQTQRRTLTVNFCEKVVQNATQTDRPPKQPVNLPQTPLMLNYKQAHATPPQLALHHIPRKTHTLLTNVHGLRIERAEVAWHRSGQHKHREITERILRHFSWQAWLERSRERVMSLPACPTPFLALGSNGCPKKLMRIELLVGWAPGEVPKSACKTLVDV